MWVFDDLEFVHYLIAVCQGMLIASSVDRADPWPARLATSNALELLAPHFTEDTVVPLFKFLIHDEGLGDRHPDVRRGMLLAGTAVIDSHGPSRLDLPQEK